MALPQETEVMAAVGLGNHYLWFNGSGSCGPIRRNAAVRLPAELQSRDLQPDNRLMVLARDVADHGEKDDSEYVLTRTWECLSDVIQAHIHRKHMSDAEWSRRCAGLIDYYQPPQRPWMTADGYMISR